MSNQDANTPRRLAYGPLNEGNSEQGRIREHSSGIRESLLRTSQPANFQAQLPPTLAGQGY